MPVESASVIAFSPTQPVPVRTLAVEHPTPGGVVTTVYRRWKAGDAARCRLCPVCSADADECLIAVDGPVPPGCEPSLSTRGFARSGGVDHGPAR